MLALRPNNESALLGKAITAFVLRRDVATARRCVKRCSGSETATWRYSDAFLNLYEGRLDRARAAYRAAARTPTTELSDFLQSEQFMLEILQEEPERYQLWFGVGAINVLLKEDVDAAAEAFVRFREGDKTQKYGPYHVWAEDLLAAIRSRTSVSDGAKPS